MVQVDGGCSSTVKPARDQLQGDVSLLNLVGSAAQAHICSGGIDLQPPSHACHATAVPAQSSEQMKDVDGEAL